MKRALASCKPMKMWIDGKCFEIRRFQKKSKKSAQDDGSESEVMSVCLCLCLFLQVNEQRMMLSMTLAPPKTGNCSPASASRSNSTN